MKLPKLEKLIVSIIAPQLAGAVGVFVAYPSVKASYAALVKPSFAPPNWIFGPVWTLLYLMMGVALYLVWTSAKKKGKKEALQYFWLQLLLNALWTPIFFGLGWLLVALVELIIMWIAIALTIKAFREISVAASWLLVPYLAWVSFAGLLNAALVLLN